MPDAQPNVFDPNCPSREVLALITHRWTVLVIYALRAGTRRYGELKSTIGGVSQKMLTQTLRELEAEGLVARTDHGEVPPRVDYSLTPLGRTLLETLGAVCQWAERHLPEVRAARAESDRATAALPDHDRASA